MIINLPSGVVVGIGVVVNGLVVGVVVVGLDGVVRGVVEVEIGLDGVVRGVVELTNTVVVGLGGVVLLIFIGEFVLFFVGYVNFLVVVFPVFGFEHESKYL